MRVARNLTVIVAGLGLIYLCGCGNRTDTGKSESAYSAGVRQDKRVLSESGVKTAFENYITSCEWLYQERIFGGLSIIEKPKKKGNDLIAILSKDDEKIKIKLTIMHVGYCDITEQFARENHVGEIFIGLKVGSVGYILLARDKPIQKNSVFFKIPKGGIQWKAEEQYRMDMENICEKVFPWQQEYYNNRQ
ncbi:MAG: hypothetical protein Q7J54_01465 [Candidatus Woesearchaeota archaeon]|nr:hypothetical protein [Candidatus Woesearchaeota archaeon]